MKPFWRASFSPLVIVLACLASACSGNKEDTLAAVGTTGSTPAAINVQVNSMYVTIENRAGQPLLNMRVAINPAGDTPYVTTIPRMGSGEKRDLPFSEFVATGQRRLDGQQRRFEPRGARPREVAVTAVDLVGKAYDVTVPWPR
jgi:hypothetical protein